MKKKGLLISTIVMVVVLVASLTTATYAWFTTDARTSINGFDVQVTSNSVLDIGLHTTPGVYASTDGPASFVSGTCTYSGQTVAGLGGKWQGDEGLGASIDPQIKFASVSQAVAVSTVDSTGWNNAIAAENPNTSALVLSSPGQNVWGFEASGSYAGYATGNYIFKANASAKTAGRLEGVGAAIANGNDTTSADFAYMHLGIRPTKALEGGTNNMYIVVQSTSESAIGIASAVHVAYRFAAPGAEALTSWDDVDVFDDAHQGDAITSVSLVANADNKPLTDGTDGKSTLPKVVYEMAIEEFGAANLDGAQAFVLPLQNLEANKISQVELVIYIAGWDSDCINEAIKTGAIQIGIYFGAQPAAA